MGFKKLTKRTESYEDTVTKNSLAAKERLRVDQEKMMLEDQVMNMNTKDIFHDT